MAYKVTDGIYKAVKILIKGGATYREIQDCMKISSATVGYIKNSETYEEYLQKSYESSSKYKKKMMIKEKKQKKEEPKKEDEEQKQVVEYRQNVTIQATHYMMEELKKVNETLLLISNKIAFIVDELTR